jgi:5-methylcytosine-specific restriction protein A
MPAAPMRACPNGCPEGSHRGPCPKQLARREQARQAQISKRRGSASSRGYGARHRRWRDVVLARDPICRDPYKRHPGVVVPSTVADHVVPLSKGGTWSLSNGQGLCASCHGHKTAIESGFASGRAKTEGEGGVESLATPARDHAGCAFARADGFSESSSVTGPAQEAR